MKNINNEQFVKEFAQQVKSLGGKVYYVGGYVRDKLLGKQSNDIDIEIYGITVDNAIKILSQYGEIDEIGKVFGILKVRGIDIDFAFPRKEKTTGDKHTDFEVSVDPFMSELEASSRRDFTINALMENVLTGEIVDLHNGLNDLKNKNIMYINDVAFIEDALRPLRAARFAAKLNFTVDERLISLGRQMSMSYRALPKERIFEELKKILETDKPSIALKYMDEMNIIIAKLPEISRLKLVPQNPEFHPEGNVKIHTFMVVDEARKLIDKVNSKTAFMFAALYHDIGKFDAFKIIDGKITAHGHEKIGAKQIPEALGNLTNEKKLIKQVAWLTENHMKVHNILNMKDKKIRQLMVDGDINDLLLLGVADSLGRALNNTAEVKNIHNKQMQKISDLSIGEFGKIEPYFTGKDLINKGFKPGKQIGDILNEAYHFEIVGMPKEEIERLIDKRLEKLNK